MKKFPENPSSESQVVPCGLTDKGTDVTKLIIAFRHLANALNNAVLLPALIFSYSACVLCVSSDPMSCKNLRFSIFFLILSFSFCNNQIR